MFIFCPEFLRLCQENVRNSQFSRQKSTSEFFSRGQMSGICPEFVYVNFFCKNVQFYRIFLKMNKIKLINFLKKRKIKKTDIQNLS